MVAPAVQLKAGAAPRAASLLGLGFGDCGKGLFTDALCRRWPVHTVVRFNGGAQAGHNVVTPGGRHHTFSQFGAGTFVPGVATLLAGPVVVHPLALLVEEGFLQRCGVHDALDRLLIDARCRVTTPYHQAAGRLREKLRRQAAHGTCGVGVGETVRHALADPCAALSYADLARPSLALEKLDAARRTLLEEMAALGGDHHPEDMQVLGNAALAPLWLEKLRPLLHAVPPAGLSRLCEQTGQAGTVLFEGAQGVLLDEWRGFHPHTTWSRIHPEAARQAASELGLEERVMHFGVTRSYLTRHGAGPLPTHDAVLDALAEPHNHGNGWQGVFRRGHADAVLLRYALDVAGPLDGLMVSHLDALDRGGPPVKWCQGYDVPGDAADDAVCTRDATRPGLVTALKPGVLGDLSHQERLTQLLQKATPVYDASYRASPSALIERMEGLAGCPAWFGSSGATHAHVQPLRNLD